MTPADHLRTELKRYQALRQHHDVAFRERLHALQAFQVRRLQHTHAALIADPVFHDATELFLNDIYGGIDLMPMANEIERALPIAVRMLPDTVLHTSAIAIEIMALTQDLDEAITTLLFEERGLSTLTITEYSRAFRDVGRLEDRERQLALVRELGHGLDKYVRSRIIFATFKLAARPAHKYGLGVLYDFLERGFRVMRPLGSVHELFDRMAQEEHVLITRIHADDPDPFRSGGVMP